MGVVNQTQFKEVYQVIDTPAPIILEPAITELKEFLEVCLSISGGGSENEFYVETAAKEGVSLNIVESKILILYEKIKQLKTMFIEAREINGEIIETFKSPKKSSQENLDSLLKYIRSSNQLYKNFADTYTILTELVEQFWNYLPSSLHIQLKTNAQDIFKQKLAKYSSIKKFLNEDVDGFLKNNTGLAMFFRGYSSLTNDNVQYNRYVDTAALFVNAVGRVTRKKSLTFWKPLEEVLLKKEGESYKLESKLVKPAITISSQLWGENIDLEILSVHEFYDLVNPQEIKEYLSHNKYLLTPLSEISSEVIKYFSSGFRGLSLKFFNDPEISDRRGLVVIVRVNLTIEKAFEYLENFYKTWWLSFSKGDFREVTFDIKIL